MKRKIKVAILFVGLVMTLYKPLWFIGMILMIVGFYLLSKGEENDD